MLITVSNVCKFYGAREVLHEVGLQLHAGQRVGLVGANGSGKTTLLRILVGMEGAESGEVRTPRGVRIGYLEQEPDLDPDATVEAAALSAFDDLRAIEREMREIEGRIAEAEASERADLARLHGEFLERFEREGGYEHESRARAALDGVGFGPEERVRPVGGLSGGERSRLALARMLLRQPDLLLLDEPTNHLDLAGVEWLEQFLRRYPGGALVVSHDRAFLDNVATGVYEIERSRLTTYPGNYARFQEIKAERRLAQRRAYEKQQEFIASEEAFIRRYGAGQRYKEARGRRKRLDRVERLERPAEARRVRMSFRAAKPSGAICYRVRGLAKRFGERTLFEGLDFELYPGERAGIVGPNGCGKTTLLKVLLGQADVGEGEVDRGHNLTIGYYDQFQEGLRDDSTPLDEVWDLQRKWNEVEVRDLLALFLFRGDDIHKRVGDLSGGERGRLALAKLMAQAPNLLVLDEPMRHLDIPSREALERALSGFDGAVLAVSHDRYFLNRVVSKLLVFEPPRIRVVNGDYALYERMRAELDAPPMPKAEAERPAPKRKAPPISKNRLARIEARIIELEEALEELDARLRDPEVYADGDRVRELTSRRVDVSAELGDLNAQWEAAAEAMSEE